MIHVVFAGTNFYVGAHEYPNPPIMAIVLKPFADLPPTAGALAWFYAKVLMAALAAVWVFRLVSGRAATVRERESHTLPDGRGSAGLADAARALALLLALPPLLGDPSHNN